MGRSCKALVIFAVGMAALVLAASGATVPAYAAPARAAADAAVQTQAAPVQHRAASSSAMAQSLAPLVPAEAVRSAGSGSGYRAALPCPPVIKGQIRWYPITCTGDDYYSSPCEVGAVLPVYIQPGSRLSNGCSAHVILYTGIFGKGTILCVNPLSATGELFRAYLSVLDTGVGGRC